jgi:uncharacterized protein
MPALAVPPRLPPAVVVADAERAALLAVARRAVLAAANGTPEGAILASVDAGAAADRRGAAFVSLFNRGVLRGCVGLLDPSRAVAESVTLAAVGAVRHDGRFRQVRAIELPDTEIEISVLGPFVALADPLTFRLGTDGLFVARGFARGLLLPEVATEHDLDAKAMLDATCLKAGLPRGAWRDPGATVYAFRTDHFGGPATVA